MQISQETHFIYTPFSPHMKNTRAMLKFLFTFSAKFTIFLSAEEYLYIRLMFCLNSIFLLINYVLEKNTSTNHTNQLNIFLLYIIHISACERCFYPMQLQYFFQLPEKGAHFLGIVSAMLCCSAEVNAA